ncbi:hypothetical protein KSF78_0004488 [Schistosoma japonicum]|nr:hypothetical protein KSF78_0004488 [Schistosoma japonicum]
MNCILNLKAKCLKFVLNKDPCRLAMNRRQLNSNESYFKTLNYSIQFVNSCNPGLIINNTNYISNNDTDIYSSNVYPSTSVNQVNHSTMIQL